MRKPTAVLLVLSLAALALALVPAAGLAGKGGKPGGGGGGGTPPPSAASVTVSPNPAVAGGARVDVTGCGYQLGVVELRIEHSAGDTEAYANGVWSDGCMNPTYFNTAEPGTYTVSVYQSGGKRNSTQVLKASTTLTVV